MAKVIGFDPKINKKFTCLECGAIVEYSPNEVVQKYWNNRVPVTDEGTNVVGLNCPNCSSFHRTNP